MYSDELQFLKFLNNLIQMQNKKYYNNVSIVSASTRGDPSTALISSDNKMINFEDLVLDHYRDNNSPAIVDGLYFNFNNKNELCLFFIEFKGNKLNKKAWKNYFKENIKKLPENVCSNQHEDCPITKLNQHSLNKIYEQYADEILVQLKMKPLESLLIAIPTLFKHFSGLDSKSNYLLNNYFNCYIYVVHAGGDDNPLYAQLTSNDVNDKYALFKNNGLIYDYMVLTEKNFNIKMISKMKKFPIHFLNNMLGIIDDYKDESGNPNFKELIVDRLNEELKNESLNIPHKHKLRLVEVILKYCNSNQEY